MRSYSSGLIVLAFLILTAPVASAMGVEILNRQKVTAEFGDEDDVRVYRFHALEGDRVSLSFKVPKKGELEPVLVLIGPEAEFDVPPLVDGKTEVEDLVIDKIGLHHLLVYGAGTSGAYTLKFRQKHATVEPQLRPVPAKYHVWLPAGAKAKIKVKAEGGSDLHPGIDRIVDPAGNEILDPEQLRERKGLAKAKILKATCIGYYTVYLAARQGAGNATITTKFKPEKAWTKKLNEKTTYRSRLATRRSEISPGVFRYDMTAEVSGSHVISAVLRYPTAAGLKDVSLAPDGSWLRYNGPIAAGGVYYLTVTLANGNVAERAFRIGAGWPAARVLTVTDGSARTPTISWDVGTGEFFVIEVMEYDAQAVEWVTRFLTLIHGNETSFTVPDGPLDAVPHAVRIHEVTPNGRWIPAEYYPPK
jgi:hypothetical protein